MSLDVLHLPSEGAPLYVVSDCGGEAKVGVVWGDNIIHVNGSLESFDVVAPHFDFPFQYLVFLTDHVDGDDDPINPGKIAAEGELIFGKSRNNVNPNYSASQILTFYT